MTPPLITAARRSDQARWLAGAAALLAMAVGALVLAGWALDIVVLKSVLPGLIPMATNTALSFILTGGALWVARNEDAAAPARWVATACAAAVMVVGLFTLLGYLGWTLNIGYRTLELGRMAPTTALNFLLLGCVLLLDRPRTWTFRTVLAAVFAYTALAVSLITLAGYLYGVDSFFQLSDFTPMAVHTAATFVLLSAGVLCAHPERGLVALLASATTGGIAARRLLPVALVIPVLLGAVRLEGQRRGWYGTELGVALFALASSGVIGILVWWTGRSLHRIDTLRAQAEHDQRASEEGARLALDAARLGTFDWEIPQNKIVWSSRHEAPWGFAPGEFGGTFESFTNRVHHQDLPGVNAEVARCMAGHESFLHEFRVVRPDGSTRWIEARGKFHFDSSGLALRMRGVVLDITERRRAVEQQALHGAALNAAADAMLITDANGTIEWVNAAFTRSTGYGADDALGRNPRDLFKSGVHDQAFYRHLWETILAGQVWSGEMTNRRKDGSVSVEDQTISPVRNAAGEIAHFIAVKRDVTDRKRAADQLRDQAQLLDNARDAIIVRSLDHYITYWNKGAERLYGWTAAEAVGQSVDNLGSNRTAEFELALKDVLRTEEWIGELHQTSKSGHKLIVDSRWALVRDEAGTPKSILAINTDVTERKLLEQQFLRAQRLESIGTLAGGIAHDLNNVLAPILMSTELLKDSLVGEGDAALLNTIEASAKRGADLVGQVLLFARGTDGRRTRVSLERLIRDMETIARETFPKHINIRVAIGPGLWTMHANPTQLHQVLMNLCVNARDAMPDGGQLSITARNVRIDAHDAASTLAAQPRSQVVIEVEDTGTGIPPAVIDKIFDPFFTTKALGKGTGLGLSTSATIVKNHGGVLRVQSKPGAGTRFAVYLPAGADECAGQTATEPVALPRGRGELVLVVDDEVAIREITRQTLEVSGYRVLLAAHGAEAVALYRQHHPGIAAVVIDGTMPVMDGATAIDALVAIDAAVRILQISGVLQHATGGTGPARPFLAKPFTAAQLLTALRQLLAAE